MIWSYSERIDEYEKMLITTLFTIEQCPGAYIGEASLDRLFYLISGYELAFNELKGYRLYFDNEFQKFVEKKYASTIMQHWNSLISNGRSDAESFREFYLLLREFIQ